MTVQLEFPDVKMHSPKVCVPVFVRLLSHSPAAGAGPLAVREPPQMPLIRESRAEIVPIAEAFGYTPGRRRVAGPSDSITAADGVYPWVHRVKDSAPPPRNIVLCGLLVPSTPIPP